MRGNRQGPEQLVDVVRIWAPRSRGQAFVVCELDDCEGKGFRRNHEIRTERLLILLSAEIISNPLL